MREKFTVKQIIKVVNVVEGFVLQNKTMFKNIKQTKDVIKFYDVIKTYTFIWNCITHFYIATNKQTFWQSIKQLKALKKTDVLTELG